jgi:hypothetical protein
MKLNSLSIAAVLVLASGCAPEMQSLVITGIFPPPTSSGGTCVGTKPAIAQTRGFMNVGLTRSYLMIFAVDSLFVDNDLTPSGNTAVINEIDYAYATSAGPQGSPVGGLPSSETRSITFTAAAESKDNLVLDDLIGPSMALALDGVPTTPANQYFNLSVTVSFKGTLLSGGAAQTNRVTFPISIYNVARTAECPMGSIINPSSPCGNVGQDVTCCTADAMDPTICAG